MKNRFSLIIPVLLCATLCFEACTEAPPAKEIPWQSELLSMDADGNLRYHPNKKGEILPDFSFAGYGEGIMDIPDVPVVREVSPQAGDNTAYLQGIIDSIGSLPPDTNGFRGTIYLQPGVYEVRGTLRLRHSGIVLRGAGDGEDPSRNTVIHAKGNIPEKRDVIVVGADSLITGEAMVENTRRDIVTPNVPVGSFSFDIADTQPYRVGDRIMIYHPCSEQWLEAIDRGGVPTPGRNEADNRWTKDLLPIVYHRTITAIDGNRITINAPVFYTLNRELSASYIYKPRMEGLVSQVGLEHLRVDIETAGGVDENHAWQAVRVRSAENGWISDCTLLHFGQSGVFTECANNITVERCRAIDPVCQVRVGERAYNFNTYTYSQLILFKDCYANKGRHHYVSNGTSSASGIVFLHCVSDGGFYANEGHRKWTSGMLYDNLKEQHVLPVEGWRKFIYHSNMVIGFYNREAIGTGHGWGAVNSVCWHCDADRSMGRIVVQEPPTAQNYAIGCQAKEISGMYQYTSWHTAGHIEGTNRKGLTPRSLYEAQLQSRK